MSDGTLPTRYYKVVSREGEGQKVQYAAWRVEDAALFSLGEPALDGLTASDPSLPPDTTTPRPATVHYLFRKVRSEDQLRKHIEEIAAIEFMDELFDRPPIGDINLGNYQGDVLVIGPLLT
ncbi:MAG TPA: hypothetical protein PLW65_28390 [Pseudomonadota bacterium]|nr:hypothetical protein [Pseudomonadota bacterium]